jgi:hypothetical protein
MATLQTILWFLIGLALAFVSGYGLLRYLLPEYLQEYRFVIAIPSGYSVLVWLAFTLSGAFSVVVPAALCVSFTVLAGITAFALFTSRSSDSWRTMGHGIAALFLLAGPMICVILWPLFLSGASTYLGAVNPDFTFAVKDLFYLKGHVSTAIGGPFDGFAPFQSSASNLPVHARYIGSLFGLLLEMLFSVSGRTGLTIAVSIWLAAIPGSVFFLSRVALGFDLTVSRVAAVLCAISAPYAMSYFLFFVGQNSTLALAPILLALLYLLFTRPCLKLFVLTAILSCALFWMYPVMLPYVLGPIGGLLAYLMATRRLKLTVTVLACLGIAGMFSLTSVSLGTSFLRSYALDWQNLFRGVTWGRYFEEFVTERFPVYFFGVASYPFENALLARLLGGVAILAATALAALAGAALLAALIDWGSRQSDKRPPVLVAAAWIMFAAVWWNYTFHNHYGYGLLKMMSWVQFTTIPVAACGLIRVWRLVRPPCLGRAWRTSLAAALALSWLAIGTASSLEYGAKGMGLETGGVNVPRISRNHDYLELENEVPRRIRPDQSVGLAFSDSIQTEWASYYLRAVRLSILSHLYLPFAEQDLPEDQPGAESRNPGSNRQEFVGRDNLYFHGAADDYYLLSNPDQPTADIIDQDLPAPVWRDRTFQLIRAADVKDFSVTGRGYYSLERAPLGRSYWWPDAFRWSARGGEVYLFRPSAMGKPYRLSLVLMTGYGLKSARRVVSFYRDGTIFDEIAINGNSRVLTKTFVVSDEVERIVFRVREEVACLPRTFALWNTSIPNDDRHLNVAAAEIRVVPPGDLGPSSRLGEVLSGGDILRRSTAFDGMEVDGWVRDMATLSFVAPAAASRLRLNILVPRAPSFIFPFPILFDVDGHAATSEVSSPGSAELTFPLTPSPNQRAIRISIRPSQSFLPVGYDQSHRETIHSVNLQSLAFEP